MYGGGGSLWYSVAMFTVDTSDIKRMERELKGFAHRAFPYATRQTVNDAAFGTMRQARQNVRMGMTTRNKHTLGSIRVNQSRTLQVSQQAAAVGSVADYMERQEFGGTRASKGREGVPIPTSYSSGEGMAARPRKRMPRRPNRIRNVRLSNKRTRGSRKQRNAAAVRMAATSGQRYVFLDLQKHRGIFRVLGGAKRPRVRMVWDMTRRTVQTPRNPWLLPAVRTVQPTIPRIYARNLRFQLKRNNLFRNR